jgi:hypothetical protein
MQFTFSVLFLAFAIFASADDTAAPASTSGINIAPLSSILYVLQTCGIFSTLLNILVSGRY